MVLLEYRTELLQAFAEDSNSVLCRSKIRFFLNGFLWLAALSMDAKSFSAQKYSELLK